MIRRLSSDPLIFSLDTEAVEVEGAETTVDLVTVDGTTIAGIEEDLASKIGDAPSRREELSHA